MTETPNQSPSLQQPRNPKAARILEAASACFSQKGFQGTTVEDIAGAAGVSRPLVYKHFGHKDALIDSVLEAAFEDWLAYNREPFETSSDTAAAALEAKLLGSVDFARQRPIFQAILRQDPRIVFSGHAVALRRCRALSRATTLAILRAGVASGEFRADLDLEATADSVEMVLFVMLERALGIRPDLTLEVSLLAATIELLLGGLRAPGRGT
jgi:AcrR family transcriptional regulator